MPQKPGIYITLFIFIIAALAMGGCSSSSNSERYDKPPKERDRTTKSHVRFSSANDEKEKKEEETSTIDEEEVEPAVDREEFIQKYSRFKNYDVNLTPRERIILEIINFLDTPYQYGGNNFDGIDCSAFTLNVFRNSLGINLPRTASEQFQKGSEIPIGGKLEFGDLVFFNTTSSSYPGHVGIYVGEDQFAHASASKGVIISSLKSNYFSNRYVGGRRIDLRIFADPE